VVEKAQEEDRLPTRKPHPKYLSGGDRRSPATSCERGWGYNAGSPPPLETHIYRLRQKIEKDPASAAILITDPRLPASALARLARSERSVIFFATIRNTPRERVRHEHAAIYALPSRSRTGNSRATEIQFNWNMTTFTRCSSSTKRQEAAVIQHRLDWSLELNPTIR